VVGLRWLTFLILLTLIPRLAFAQTGGVILCLGQDHVQTGCHSDEGLQNSCKELPGQDLPHSESGESDCIDLATPCPEAQPQRAALPAAEQLALPPLLVLWVLPVPTPPTASDASVDPPRAFCARAFTCSIVIRC
jgi:hypothetical protein